MKTAVMTDTNSGITVQRGRELGIYVLPMPETIDGKDYLEGEGITLHDFYARIAQGAEASSSQAAPGDFISLFERAFEDGYDEIVYIPMSSSLSGAYETAATFAKEYGGRVQVADNRRISVSLEESCLDAVRLRDRGMDAAGIRRVLERDAGWQQIYVTVDTVKRLVRSGRVTAAGGAIADILHIKPVLQIQEGKVDAFAKARSIKQAERIMTDAIKKELEGRFASIPAERIKLSTAASFVDESRAAAWRDRVQAAFPDFSVGYTPLSCSVVCHVGANAFGVAVIMKEE